MNKSKWTPAHTTSVLLVIGLLVWSSSFVLQSEAESLSPACASFYSSTFTMSLATTAVDPIPTLAKPVKGMVYSEPTYKTCTVRSTDHNADNVSGFARNDYSRRQAFNADNSKQLVYALDGSWHLYNANTHARIKQLPGLGGDAEPQWHSTDPSIIYYVPTDGIGMVLYELNIVTDANRVVGNFAARLKAKWPTANAAWTKSEGSPSANGRYWCLMVDDGDWQSLGVFTWDRDTDTILGTYNTNGDRPDHVSMSPSGNYCVVAGDGDLGTIAFTRDFSSQTKLLHVSQHSDLAFDANGDDTYVAVDYSTNGGEVFMVNIRTGVRTPLFDTYISGTAFALHVSGKAFNRPGWVVLSTYAEGGGSRKWPHAKIMAVQLAANPKIYNLGFHRSGANGYWTTPVASVNRDFTRIVYNSNWGSSSGEDVDVYVIEIPANALGSVTVSSTAVSSSASSTAIASSTAVASSSSTGSSGGTLTPACQTFYAGTPFTLSNSSNVLSVSSLAKPKKGVVFSEPTYKTCVYRATDHAVDSIDGFARNDYSRRQAFNADSSKQLIYALNGAWHIYSTTTHARLKVLIGLGGDAEPQWHSTDPNIIYWFPTNGVGMELNEMNVTSNANRVIGSWSARVKAKWPTANAAWTKSEGSPSANGRYWCLMVDDGDWQSLGVFTWDRDTDTILGTYNTNGDRPDHVSMSPSGNYCVVAGDGDLGLAAFTRDMTSHKQILPKSEHSDIALDANGDDIFVTVDYQSNAGDLFMTNLRTNVRTVLFSTYIGGTATALHISGKAYNRPGWIVLSTYAEYVPSGTTRQWIHEKVMAVELKANPRVFNLAYHRAVANGYWTEPHASVNRDFTRIVYNSNWGVDTDIDVDAYVVEIPANILSGSGTLISSTGTQSSSSSSSSSSTAKTSSSSSLSSTATSTQSSSPSSSSSGGSSSSSGTNQPIEGRSSSSSGIDSPSVDVGRGNAASSLTSSHGGTMVTVLISALVMMLN